VGGLTGTLVTILTEVEVTAGELHPSRNNKAIKKDKVRKKVFIAAPFELIVFHK